MPLDERIAAFLTASADAPPPASLAEMRAATETGLRRLQGEAEPSGGVRDYTVIAADGYRIALRAYLPARENCAAAQPAMLFAHGGGWCLGSLALYDRPCQALANATGRVILSVDYRLAPEYPFPQPLEDVYQALCWVAQQAPQLGIDAQRLAVGGDSAGEIWRRRSRCWRGIAAARTSSASCCCTRRSAARWRRRAIASLPRGTF